MESLPSQLTITPATEARFQQWMAHAMTALHLSASDLAPEQIALVTLAAQKTIPDVNLDNDIPETTCTLRWRCGCWTLGSFSNLTLVEEKHPPRTEYAFWLGSHPVGYRMQWEKMSHQETAEKLREWELSLHGSITLQLTIAIPIAHTTHEISFENIEASQ